MGDQPRVFVSYSHADTKWLNELDPHLKGLQLYAKIEPFDDRQLLAGDDWDAAVKAALERADIILLLVTAHFIGSSYIHRVELPNALKRREKDGAIVIPILCEECARKLLAIDDINYIPKDRNGALRPLAEWRGVQRAKGLTQVTEHILRQIERLRDRTGREIEASKISGIDLTLYRQRAQAKWFAIDLSALTRPGAIDAEITIRLTDVFVPQFARRSRPVVSLFRYYLEKQGIDAEAEAGRAIELEGAWQRSAPVPALDLVLECRQRHLVLLGDPGAGKSALARYILLQLLNNDARVASPLAPLSDHLPFLIELRDFVAREAEGRCTDPLGYLAYCGRELGFGFNENSLEEQFSRRSSLMIVDGLDEIFDPRRRRLMVDQIIGLTGRYPKLRLLITSRIAGFDDNPFRAAEFAIATLIDLTPDQIQEFAKAWFTIVFPADPDAAARAGNDLLETLQRRPQLQTIAGNPMILTIMATVARHKRLGRSRAAIYDQALELLCYNWDYKRGLGLPSDSPLIDLHPDDTALMLRRIAWHMQEAPEGLRANAIEEATLHGILDDFFQQDWHFNIPKARRAASEMLYRLQVRNWVLTLRGPALYGFVHRTFLEYLCALELSERFRAQQLDTDTLVTNHVTPRLDDDTWHEVLRLLVGLLPPAAAERILVAILPSNTVDPTEWPRLALAWQGLSEVEPRSLPNLMQTGARLIDVLHDGLARGERVYWESLDAISEAAQAIGPVTWTAIHPPSGEWPSISFETRFQGFRYHQTTTLGLFAAWFTGDPETEPLLRFRVIEDQDKNCRSDALTSLARHFREDPETKGLL